MVSGRDRRRDPIYVHQPCVDTEDVETTGDKNTFVGAPSHGRFAGQCAARRRR